jgi:hypothetical protein
MTEPNATPQPQVLTQEFMALLQANAEEFKKAEVISDWMPPDGDYAVVGGTAVLGTTTKEGKPPFNWFRLPCRINAPSNPELHDKSFTMMYGTTINVGMLKSACSGIAGRVVDSIMEIPSVLASADGTVYSVNVTTNKKGYKNVSVTQIHR